MLRYSTQNYVVFTGATSVKKRSEINSFARSLIKKQMIQRSNGLPGKLRGVIFTDPKLSTDCLISFCLTRRRPDFPSLYSKSLKINSTATIPVQRRLQKKILRCPAKKKVVYRPRPDWNLTVHHHHCLNSYWRDFAGWWWFFVVYFCINKSSPNLATDRWVRWAGINKFNYLWLDAWRLPF